MSVTTGSLGTADFQTSSPSLYGLDGVNFFLAAILAGFGPYVAAYLAEQKWTQTDIGLVLTASSVAGLLSQVPGGELLDKVHSKRAVVAVGAGIVILSALSLRSGRAFRGLHRASAAGGDRRVSWTGDCCDQPWLGWFAALAERLGRNQRFASTGALAGAALDGLRRIPTVISGDIRDRRPCSDFRCSSLCHGSVAARYPLRPILRSSRSPWSRATTQDPATDFLKDSQIVVFAACLFLFQLANASVLPLAGEALVRRSEMNSSLIISALIIVPQILVALMAPWVGRQAQSWGRASAFCLSGSRPCRSARLALL